MKIQGSLQVQPTHLGDITMTDAKNYTDAHNYIDTFYRRKKDQLQAMSDAANIAADNFYRIMKEPALQSLGEIILVESFKFALTAVPGAIFVSKTWLALAEQHPRFAAQAQFLVTTAITAGQSVQTVSSQAGSANSELARTLPGMLKRKMDQIYQRLDRGFSALEKEHTDAETYLTKLPGPNYLQTIMQKLGPHDPILTPAQRQAMRTNFELELFKAYAKNNATIIENHNRVWGLMSTSYDGFNNVQIEYIRTELGIGDLGAWLRKIGAKVHKNVFTPRGRDV